MKILYAIQGTGNGHLSRARAVIPILQRKGSLDILISGTQADVELPYPVKYKFDGLSFVFGKKGGIELFQTYKKSNLRRLFREINIVPIEQYDIVINDFEPVSAWACYFKNKHCIALSHQAAVLNKKAPRPKHADAIGKSLLKNYAPTTSQYGFHFNAYDKNIFTPVIRSEIRVLEPKNKGHYCVYLPAFHDDIIAQTLSKIEDVRWEVFSKHNKKPRQIKNVFLQPITNEGFIKSLRNSEGVLCGAGFETPAEALFLQKKLMVIPMKHQFEQHCNAAALNAMGIPVLKNLKSKQIAKIEAWIDKGSIPSVVYPDVTECIVNMILEKHVPDGNGIMLGKRFYSESKFSKFALKKILANGSLHQKN